MRLDISLLVCVLSVCVAWCSVVPGGGRHNATCGEGEACDVVRRAAQLGLVARAHAVRTADGYVLRLFRLRGRGRGGPPVLLMHGLLQGAGTWLDAGGAALAARLGARRDVWLGGARGSHLSRRHAWLRPDTDARYWRFSADEIGRYDLPALVDRVLAATGSDTLHYVGFSQGAGAFFIMCAELPHYCRKVSLMVALAPATRMLHTSSIPFRLVTEYYKYNEEKLYKNGVWEALPQGGLVQFLLQNLCGFSDAGAKICEVFKDILDGRHPGSITDQTMRALVVSTPAGTSVHNMAWYGQLVNSQTYHKFDYGPARNLVLYGTETAPTYNLSAVTVPTVVVYGRNDGIADVRDVKWLVKQLPNVTKVIEIEDPLWTHFDFVLSKEVPQLLYPKIDEVLG